MRVSAGDELQELHGQLEHPDDGVAASLVLRPRARPARPADLRPECPLAWRLPRLHHHVRHIGRRHRRRQEGKFGFIHALHPS